MDFRVGALILWGEEKGRDAGQERMSYDRHIEVDGDWPWNEAFFPKPSAITSQDGQ